MANIFLENSLLFALTQIVPLLYIVTTALYGIHFFRETPLAGSLKQPALILTVVTHVADLGLLTSTAGYRLSYSAYNLMSMVALTLAITYMFIEFTTKSDKTGFFVIAFATGSALFSSILSAHTVDSGLAFSGLGIGVHLIAAIFGFSSVAIAGLYSGMYLVLFRQIRLNRFGLLFQRLPNLEASNCLSCTPWHSASFSCRSLLPQAFLNSTPQGRRSTCSTPGSCHCSSSGCSTASAWLSSRCSDGISSTWPCCSSRSSCWSRRSCSS